MIDATLSCAGAKRTGLPAIRQTGALSPRFLVFHEGQPVAGVALDDVTLASVVAALGSTQQPVAIDRARIDRQIRELALEHAGGLLGDDTYLSRLKALGDKRDAIAERTAPGLPGPPRNRVPTRPRRVLPSRKRTQGKEDLMHTIYDRIMVAGFRIVGARLTQAAHVLGLALALPRCCSQSRIVAIASALLLVGLLPAQVGARNPGFSPGATGAGDPYYPLDGNGGYDVRHYDLDIGYAPPTGVLTGVATISARATQNLSRFDLDLVGLTVRSIRVDGRQAAWSRDGQELVITPARGIGKGAAFEVVVRYDGVPQRLEEFGTPSGFLPTDDGFAILGEPHGAAYWFPANDHPTDKASFTFEVTVPGDLQVIANGRLVDTRRHGPVTTWTWDAPDPMATYLATVDAGHFNIHTYKRNGIRFLDAIDPDLYAPFAVPHPGTRFAYSQQADSSYKRLMRTIHVPAGGGTLTFLVTRDIEREWDFFFVEAHHPGADDWTTLPEQSGITTNDLWAGAHAGRPGTSCYGWADLHPFIAHYQAVVPPADPDDPDASATCEATGTTGVWNAATGASNGAELWTIDLGGYAGGDVEVSLSYASDDIWQYAGVAIDDVTWPGGSTSFEADADPMDGWTVPGAPDGSPGNDTDWIVGDASVLPPTIGDNVDEVFAQVPEVVSFLVSQFGPYPFATAGGVVDDIVTGFALETQTRPIYAKGFFLQPDSGVPAHEFTHQWYGDSVTIERWSDFWLNEGFATYAEWLWSEHQGGQTPQAFFDDLYGIPDDDPFWTLVIADPGPDGLADWAIYFRSAMTLQVLRTTVGDDAFFRILRGWAKSNAGGNVSTQEFIRYAERVSGQDLDALFNAWLYTPSKPVIAASPARSGAGLRN